MSTALKNWCIHGAVLGLDALGLILLAIGQSDRRDPLAGVGTGIMMLIAVAYAVVTSGVMLIAARWRFGALVLHGSSLMLFALAFFDVR
jgi:hypothetical protein